MSPSALCKRHVYVYIRCYWSAVVQLFTYSYTDQLNSEHTPIEIFVSDMNAKKSVPMISVCYWLITSQINRNVNVMELWLDKRINIKKAGNIHPFLHEFRLA